MDGQQWLKSDLALNDVRAYNKHLAKDKKYAAYLREVRNAVVVLGNDWSKVQPQTLFKTEDGTIYYKKANGEVTTLDKLMDYILYKIENKS